MTEESSHPANHDEKAPSEIQRKRGFTLHEKRISDTMQVDFLALFDENRIEFRKKTAAMLRENPDLFNINEIGTVSDEHAHVSLEQWQGFLSDLLKPELSQKIFECIDHDNTNTVAQTAITRFLSGRSKVAQRQATIIDEAWLVDKLKDVDIGKIDEIGNNKIGLSEFKNYFHKLRKEIPDDMVETLFHEIDSDKDGYISTFEYFRWKEGAKIQGVLQQRDVPKIRKSTTKLKLLKGSQRGNKMTVHFKDDDDDGDETVDDITQLKHQIAQLMRENAEKDDLIKDKNVEIMKLKDVMTSSEVLKQRIKDKDIKIREYESKMESLKGNNEYDDVESLNKLLEEKNELIEKIKHENDTEMAMVQKDKDNLYEQLEETYDIVNDELIGDSKYNKKRKSKAIENATDLRKKLKKLKSKIDVKDEKIKEFKSQRMLSNYEDKTVNEKNEEDVLEEKGKHEGLFSFRNLLVFLKDF